MLSVVMLSVIMLSVVMLSVIMLSVVRLSGIMLSVIMLSVVKQNSGCLSFIVPEGSIQIKAYYLGTIVNNNRKILMILALVLLLLDFLRPEFTNVRNKLACLSFVSLSRLV
jgi:hypothetical protein